MIQEQSHLRLRTLVWLRWFALFGQALTLSFVYFKLEFEFPFLACGAIIFLSVLLNIWLRFQFPAARRLHPPYVLLTLSYDVIQLSILLYLTGGMQNPFAFFLLIPITISATTQPAYVTICLTIIAILSSSILVVFHQPLPWIAGETFRIPEIYIMGQWVAAVIGLLFISFYAWRISRESTQMSNALAATEMVLARAQRLSALDGLAAAAAHELGTPLATITLVTKEMLKEAPSESSIYQDLELLNTQASRCRDILSQLSSNKAGTDEVHNEILVSQLIGEAVENLSRNHKSIEIHAHPAPDTELIGPVSKEPLIFRNPGVLYALGNIISNAQDFAQSSVNIFAEWTADKVIITVKDDGPGFHEDILGMLGEPYVTTRPVGQIDLTNRSDGIGMGLGFFIAKTLLERSGASLDIRNFKEDDEQGAVVQVIWEREEVDIAFAAFKNSENYYFRNTPYKEKTSKVRVL